MKMKCATLFKFLLAGWTASFIAAAAHGFDGDARRQHINGRKAFADCANCHTLEQGGEHLLGPNLYGVYGRKIAAFEDFPYSDALKNMQGVWDDNALNRYIARPKLAAPDNQMPYQGLTSPHLRADLIAWLKTNPGKYVPPSASLPEMIRRADIEHGQDLAAACLACHAAGKDMPHRIAPNLWGGHRA